MEVRHVFKKRRLVAAGALAGLALFAMGAAQLSHELREQPRRCFRQVHEVQDWSLTMLTEVRGGESTEWLNVAGQAPLLVVEGCCRATLLQEKW